MEDAPAGDTPNTTGEDPQLHITTFWSTVAPGYEEHAGNVADSGSPEYQMWLRAPSSVLPTPPSDVLDVATGTGYVALAAASLGHRVVAVDLSAAMLDELAARARSRGLVVDAQLGDAVAPDFAPASFDALTSRHLLWTLREPARAMANWRALLRPGGRLVAVDGFWFSDEDAEVPALFAQHYGATTRAALPFMGIDEPGPILAALRSAGFIEAQAESRPELEVGAGATYLITARRPTD